MLSRDSFRGGTALKYFDPTGSELGMVKQRVFTLPPKFDLYRGATRIGSLKRNFLCSGTGTISIATAGMWRATGWAGIIPL